MALLSKLMANAGIRRRKKDPGRNDRVCPQADGTGGEKEPPREKDSDPLEEELTEWDLREGPDSGDQGLEVNPENQDYEENLTFHEDSLSVMRGKIVTVEATGIPIWITTDSGSMTQLIQKKYARRLKIKRRPLPTSRWFSIKGPGGGEDMVTEYVVIKVSIKMKRYNREKCGYDDLTSPEVTKEIKLTFGVCEDLPVPILWGGKQMRRYGLVDYHDQKLLSLRPEGVVGSPEYAVESTSWLIAAADIYGYLKGPLVEEGISGFPSYT